jgi:hypothetical protein
MLFAALTLTKRIPALAVVAMVASDAPVGTAYAAADFLALALTREVGDLVTAAGLFAGDACNLMPSRPRMDARFQVRADGEGWRPTTSRRHQRATCRRYAATLCITCMRGPWFTSSILLRESSRTAPSIVL